MMARCFSIILVAMLIFPVLTLYPIPDKSYVITNSICSINVALTGGVKYSDYLGNGFSLETYYFY